MELIVTPQEHGWTLLAFLKEKYKGSFSSNKIKKAIESKSCKINGRIEVFSSYQVRLDDRIEFNPPAEEASSSKIAVVFEDEFFAVINKPPGLISENEKVLASIGIPSKNWRLVHRLDKDTSGLLFLAKSSLAEEAGKLLFSQREVQKIYLAIVDGRVKEKEGVIDNLLGKKGGYQGQTLYGKVKEKGLRAITHFKSLAIGKSASLVLCDLKTGRTHQIRVHFSEKGHPILGDSQYGQKGFESSYLTFRHLLHAWKLSFIHPFTKQTIEIEAPLPNDFKIALELLFAISDTRNLNERI